MIRLVHVGFGWFICDSVSSCGIRLVHVGFGWFICDSVGSYVIRLVHVGFGWFVCDSVGSRRIRLVHVLHSVVMSNTIFHLIQAILLRVQLRVQLLG